MRRGVRVGAGWALAAVLAVTIAGAGAPSSLAQERPAVTIGSKNFTESLLIGEMYALLLEANGFKVNRKLNLAGTLIAHGALVKGEIDLYPEYTGTALLNMLKLETMSDRKKVYDKVKDEYAKQFQLVWLDAAPMNNTQAVAVTQAIAKKHNMTTLSRMSVVAPQLVMAAVPEFTERPDGLKGLQRVYGGFNFKKVNLVDYGVKYRALTGGQADATVAFGTDGEIIGYKLVVMKDDKGLWPPYQVAPVVRKALLDKAPGVAKALNRVAGKMTDATMQRLNWEVDGKKREYADVAKEFLKTQKLIP
jgi:osmoprotectant transport system substrate-binding protein